MCVLSWKVDYEDAWVKGVGGFFVGVVMAITYMTVRVCVCVWSRGNTH